MVYVIQVCWQLARKLSANLYDIYHCCVCSKKLLMMDRGTVRNMQSFITKINFQKLVHLVGFIIRIQKCMFSVVAKYQLIYIVYASQLYWATCRSVQCRETLFFDAHRILIVGFCQTQEAEAAPFRCPWVKTTFVHIINFFLSTLRLFVRTYRFILRTINRSGMQSFLLSVLPHLQASVTL
jgi:hypothetical protein